MCRIQCFVALRYILGCFFFSVRLWHEVCNSDALLRTLPFSDNLWQGSLFEQSRVYATRVAPVSVALPAHCGEINLAASWRSRSNLANVQILVHLVPWRLWTALRLSVSPAKDPKRFCLSVLRDVARVPHKCFCCHGEPDAMTHQCTSIYINAQNHCGIFVF